MKKVIVFFVMVLPVVASAQDFTWGLKGGLNMAKMKMTFGGLSTTSDDLISFHAGLYGKWKTSEKFFFQPELFYSAQGGRGNGGSFDLGYINIPVMLSFVFTPGVSLQAGPQLGLLINASVDGVDTKSDMSSVDMAIGFGIGVERPSGLNFAFRYNLGLTNTLSSSVTSILAGLGLGDVSMTNQVIQFSMGYRLSKAP